MCIATCILIYSVVDHSHTVTYVVLETERRALPPHTSQYSHTGWLDILFASQYMTKERKG